MKRMKICGILTAAMMAVSVCRPAFPQTETVSAAEFKGSSTVSAESDFVGKWILFKAIEYGELMYDDGVYPDGTPVEGNLYDLRADGTGEHVFYVGTEIFTTSPLTWSCSGDSVTMNFYEEHIQQYFAVTYQLVDGILESHDVIDGMEEAHYLRRTDYDPRESAGETTEPAVTTALPETTTAVETTSAPAEETGMPTSGTCGKDGDNLTWMLDSEGTLTISGEGEMAEWELERPWYYFSTEIKSVNISEGVTSISQGAFMNCFNLTDISIPDSVTSIGANAFYYCMSLSEITIPDKVTRIEESTFNTCDTLTSIIIPDSVTSIGEAAFSYCHSLTSITIPDNVTSIGDSAFIECARLTDITINNPNCEIYDSSDTIDNYSTIHGFTGSTAEEYATKYGRNFESLGEAPAAAEPETGDLDGDGEISVTDAQNVLLAAVEISIGKDSGLTDAQIKAADVNGDGEVSVADAQFILNYYVQNTILGANVPWSDIIGQTA